ncbi:MAG TPA: ATP-grasp domain-containing protein [Vicinamibacterales bacterium]|nr:ATP-grasp domain-containing protein [Vicinamibacterales bacterium]
MAAHVLLAGISTRAAAESAANAGFDVTAIDAFGDLDQHPSVRGLSLPRDFGLRFTARAAARASRSVECDAVAYLSSLENHPGAVAQLAAGRELWGNPPDVLRRVRDPFLVAAALRSRGFAVPNVSNPPSPHGFGAASDPNDPNDPNGPNGPNGPNDWLIKPFKSGGGHGVRRWLPGERVPKGCYAQEVIDGTPASIVFVAAGGRATPLGISRQFIGEAAFGTSGYRYCGNVLATAGDALMNDAVTNAVSELTRHVAGEFGLVGLNGIDFIVRDGVPYVLEVNPRWSASMELVERACGMSLFAAHATACRTGALPTFDLAAAPGPGSAIGKAVVFARAEVIAGDTRPWLADATVRDVPFPGTRISAGEPVCTVFAEGIDAAACHAALVRRADAVYEALARRA